MTYEDTKKMDVVNKKMCKYIFSYINLGTLHLYDEMINTKKWFDLIKTLFFVVIVVSITQRELYQILLYSQRRISIKHV